MKLSCLFFISFIILFIFSCKKDHSETPPEPEVGYSKLKKITTTSNERGGTTVNIYEIEIDSINNKIFTKNYFNNSDTLFAAFTYNSHDQLELYEAKGGNTRIYLTRMEFIRDANGQLTKVLSEYNNKGIVEKSEGICQYEKNRDTTFVTFIDSSNKRYSDEIDWYQAGLIKNRIVYYKEFGNRGAYINRSYFSYDAANNLIKVNDRNFYRGSQSPKEIQKFFNRLGGDIMWFRRQGQFRFMNFLTSIGNDYYFLGNVMERQTGDFYTLIFSNEFDGLGNLKKLKYNTTFAAKTVEFEYLP